MQLGQSMLFDLAITALTSLKGKAWITFGNLRLSECSITVHE
jgi:hypothetical protein